MNFKRGLKSIGLFLVIVGIFIVIIQPFSTTGAVIDLSSEISRIWFFVGFGMILVGIILLITKPEGILERLMAKVDSTPDIEKGPYKKSVIRYDRRLDKLKKVPYSVRDAVIEGIPTKEARKILREANKKVSSGEWVYLNYLSVRDTNDHKVWPDATSLCRYWGPEKYKDLSKKQLGKLYEKGEIGKTHELVRGSDKYMRGGKLSEGTLSLPPVGSHVLHRHWEVAEMYYIKKKSSKDNYKSLLI